MQTVKKFQLWAANRRGKWRMKCFCDSFEEAHAIGATLPGFTDTPFKQRAVSYNVIPVDVVVRPSDDPVNVFGRATRARVAPAQYVEADNTSPTGRNPPPPPGYAAGVNGPVPYLPPKDGEAACRVNYGPPPTFPEKGFAASPPTGATGVEKEKPKLKNLFRDNPETKEGKYLVKRRDGTVVEWPSFVLGARDPHAEPALLAYADSIAMDPDCHHEYPQRIRALANEFGLYRRIHGRGDPTRGKHRKDDPATIAEMRGEPPPLDPVIQELYTGLHELSCLGNGSLPGNSDGNRMAAALLDKLEAWITSRQGKRTENKSA